MTGTQTGKNRAHKLYRHGEDYRGQNSAMCHEKKPYSTEAFASGVARQCKEKRGSELRPYKCPVCLQWHLTKKGAP